MALDVLVVDGNGLRAVDLLDLVDQVALQLLDAEDRQDVVRIDRTVDERVAGAHALHLLHVDVHGAGDAVLVAGAFVGLDDDAAHALDDGSVMHGSIDLGDDGLVARVPGFEELDDARQTAGDVLGLGGGAGNLREHVAGVNVLAVVDHDVGAGREAGTCALLALAGLDDEGRGALLGGRRFDDDHLGEAGDLVGLLADVLAFDDVLEVDLAAELREHGRGERIPLDERLCRLRRAVRRAP